MAQVATVAVVTCALPSATGAIATANHGAVGTRATAVAQGAPIPHELGRAIAGVPTSEWVADAPMVTHQFVLAQVALGAVITRTGPCGFVAHAVVAAGQG